MELGVWSVGKSKSLSYRAYASRFENLNADYLTIFAVHPKASGGLTVRNPEHVADEVEAILDTGKDVRLSFWFGTQPKYFTGFADALLKLEKVLKERKINPYKIIKELDAEYHATAPGLNQAGWAVKQFKKVFPAFQYKDQFTITCLWWISPAIQELVFGLSDYLVGVTPQLYSFYKPEAKKDSALDIMRPMNIQRKGISLYDKKITENNRIRKQYSKKYDLYHNHVKAYDKLTDMMIVGLANYYQKHPNYKISKDKYNIKKALDDSFKVCYNQGFEKYCYFSMEWCYGKGNYLASKYERECAREFMSTLKKRHSSFWEKLSKPKKPKTTNVVDNTDEDMGTLSVSDKERVLIIQKLLVGIGFDIGSSGRKGNGIDGVRGKRTTEAIKAVERMLNLDEDGIPDDVVIEKLDEMYRRVHKMSAIS